MFVLEVVHHTIGGCYMSYCVTKAVSISVRNCLRIKVQLEGSLGALRSLTGRKRKPCVLSMP